MRCWGVCGADIILGDGGPCTGLDMRSLEEGLEERYCEEGPILIPMPLATVGLPIWLLGEGAGSTGGILNGGGPPPWLLGRRPAREFVRKGVSYID